MFCYQSWIIQENMEMSKGPLLFKECWLSREMLWCSKQVLYAVIFEVDIQSSRKWVRQTCS